MTEQQGETSKHPLIHEWTLFFDSTLAMNHQTPAPVMTADQWGEGIKKVWDFDTVEDFWRLFNNVVPPHQIQVGCGYNLFKKGIEPKWEDEKNKRGGRWTVSLPKPAQKQDLVDSMWLNLVMGVIGENLELESSKLVCGAVVNIRKKEDKISLWIRDASDEGVVNKIGENFRKCLEIADDIPITFRKHF